MVFDNVAQIQQLCIDQKTSKKHKKRDWNWLLIFRDFEIRFPQQAIKQTPAVRNLIKLFDGLIETISTGWFKKYVTPSFQVK